MKLDFWDSCDSHYKEIETDEIEVDGKTIKQIKNETYNQALDDVLNVVEWDGYTLDIKERIEQLKK